MKSILSACGPFATTRSERGFERLLLRRPSMRSPDAGPSRGSVAAGIVVAITMLLGLAAPARALGDIVVPVPPEWNVLTTEHAASDVRTAVGLESAEFPGKIGAVMQWWLDGEVITTVPGNPIALEYSASGTRLLVRVKRIDPATGGAHSEWSLINLNGEILWTRADERDLHFSSKGLAIDAWKPGEASFSVLSLGGVDMDTVSLSSRPTGTSEEFLPTPYRGVGGLGDGSRAAFAAYRKVGVLRVPHLGEPNGIAWSRMYPADVSKMDGITVLRGQRFGVTFMHGQIDVFDGVSSARLLTFALPPPPEGETYPSTYQGIYWKPYPTPLLDRILLYRDGDERVHVGHLDDGSLVTTTIDKSVPAGHSLTAGAHGMRLVFAGPDDFVVRPLDLPLD